MSLTDLLWDLLWTVIEVCMVCYLGRCFIHRAVSRKYDVLFIIINSAFVELMTVLNVHTFLKFPISVLLVAFIFRCLHKLDFLTGCMVYACVGIAQSLAELSVSSAVNLFELQFLNSADSPFFYKLYLYIPVHLLSALFVVLQRKLLSGIKDVLTPKMAAGITLVMLGGIYLFLLIAMNLNAFSGIYENSVILLCFLIAIAVFIGLKFFVNSVITRAVKAQEETQLKALQAKYEYYDERLKDEERIRSIYHDMKNHLLVLEGSRTTDETRKMAQELRSQIADYENYIHTGNDFLDIIIRDKAEKAREKQIDFSAFIDFGGVDFIEPLDISTLFGNGIDNAIEASEKLPEEQRVILVKAGKVQDFISILIKNNCVPEEPKNGRRTAKPDKFLHGFGISNMKKAAERYSGTCTTTQANGNFTLKILIPNTNN